VFGLTGDFDGHLPSKISVGFEDVLTPLSPFFVATILDDPHGVIRAFAPSIAAVLFQIHPVRFLAALACHHEAKAFVWDGGYGGH
jgi:hypothetical protein